MNSTEDLIEVYAPVNPAQVLLLKQLLDEKQIPSFVVNDKMEGMAGEVPFSCARPQIWVKTSDAVAARRVCEAFDQRLIDRAHGSAVKEAPFCYHCGETVTEDSQECPACGAGL